MSTAVDQKSYLQKYLGGPSKEKKKKKKKPSKGKGFKIIDDDIDLSKLRPLDGDELDILDEGEDAPQIAGIVDERPEELKKLEQFKTTSKWRVINQDDGFNSKLQIQEIQKDVKEVEKENEVIFGKMYSDSEDEKEKNASDLSPPRKGTKNDSDASPVRKKQLSPKKDTKNDSDVSPPRKHETRKERVRKPSRWGDAETENNTQSDSKRNRSPSSDMSSPRKKKNYDSDASPPRKRQSSPQHSSKIRKGRSPSSDLSPPRKSDRRKSPSPDKYQKSSKEFSRKDKDRRDYSDRNRDISSRNRDISDKSRDMSHRNKDMSHRSKGMSDRNRNMSDRNRRNNSDSDLSPPRKNRHTNSRDVSKESQRNMSKDKRKRSPSPKSRRKHDSDSDLSPPRKDRRRRSPDRQKHDSDSDLSPPRKGKNKMLDRNRDMLNKDKNRNSDSPPPTNNKMAKTLEGKMAGLQDARQLREENEEFRRKEEEVFKRLSDNVSGRNAQAVSRKSKKDTLEEKQKQKEKAERQKELDAKYKLWSKGLKQVEAQQARVQDFIHEASKPVARHRDDRDLEHSLKQVERDGDPMLQYMREKKRERGELPPERPSYKGSFPPNRFNIRPGYRWDGVDRSNGYEGKYFQQQSKRKAQEEEAYKWSTEDL